MDDPLTIQRFTQTILRSGLLTGEEFHTALGGKIPARWNSPRDLADHLIANRYLTHFQADKLLQGSSQGLVLGPYSILTPISRGGMGSVYLARRKPEKGVSSSLLALKVLPPKRAREEHRMLQRFLREMDMCRRVNHTNVTLTYDVGETQGIHYIAMEYIRGSSLKKLVDEEGPMTAGSAARIFAEVAAGLAHAHELGLIHRDLKPANIMITPEGSAKVLDLGLAMTIGEELPDDKSIVGGEGYVVGTMDYIAPEQILDPTHVDARADLYALGCSMYFVLTGKAFSTWQSGRQVCAGIAWSIPTR